MECSRLVFVKRIAEAMGGSLKVTSKPGRGSTFVMSVVVSDDAPATPRRTSAASAARKLRVLCVEDNPYGRVVLGTVLRELGHRVTFAGSGEAAIEMVGRNVHDVVMMDVALAGIDGIAATRRIRALPQPAGNVPIIGISGHTEASDAASAKAAGMDAYLRKPATPAEINDALRSVVTRAESAGSRATR